MRGFPGSHSRSYSGRAQGVLPRCCSQAATAGLAALLAVAPHAAHRQPPAAPDTGVVLPHLETRLAPVAAWRERAEAVLRGHQGTPQADVEFLSLRLELKQIVIRIASGLETPGFQFLVWPDGAEGQRLRRSQQGPERAAPAEVAGADAIVSFLKARGVWPQRVEGDTYFYPSEAALLEWLGELVSEEIRRFLRLWAHEQAMPVAEDASIQVPLVELERRILMTERFLAEFPESPVRAPVGARHRQYLALYLGGTDNTRAFDYRSGVLRTELRQAFEAYAAVHRSSASGRLVAEYLALLRANGFTRGSDVDRFLRALRDGIDVRLLRY